MDLTVLVLSSLAKMLFVLIVTVGVFAPLLVWAERRQSAMMQDRVGPTRAGVKLFGREFRLAGLLHPLADALKMIWKEDFVPPRADRFLHAIAPMLPVATGVAAFAVVPFADTLFYEVAGQYIAQVGAGKHCVLQFMDPATGAAVSPYTSGAQAQCSQQAALGPAVPMQVANLNVGILYIFALGGAGIIGAALGGYASDNKYSLLGGLRAAGQMVSYEVVLGLTIVGALMVFDTLQLDQMVRWQVDNVWGIVVQPVAFVMFLCAAIAETKRIPFDVPEGESEIAGGYLMEYSGMKFGMFFMSEFIEIVLLSAVATTIFLGGWHVPFLTASGFELAGMVLYLPHWLVITLQIVTFLLKVVFFMWLQLTIRWTLPRFRYDQIMKLCWKILLPLALVNITVTGIVLLIVG